MALQDQLRQAVRDSGLSVSAVARGAGIAQPILHRFVAGERDLTLETASKVAAFFRMRLTRPLRPKKGG